MTMIEGKDIGKKFGRNWIFRDLDFEIPDSKVTVVTGRNGAGKSTLLQIISGYLTPTKGTVAYCGKPLTEQEISISYIGPYTEILEEFTFREFLSFHQHFKTARIPVADMAESASLPLDKVISEFSTGMKQRAKLCCAFFFENDLIYMDEPTSNLDEEGFHWWRTQIDQINGCNRVIASNDSREIDLASRVISL